MGLTGTHRPRDTLGTTRKRPKLGRNGRRRAVVSRSRRRARPELFQATLGVCEILRGLVVFRSGTHTLADGDTIGPYLLGSKLGEGAAGTVYQAVRRTDRLEVAVR